MTVYFEHASYPSNQALQICVIGNKSLDDPVAQTFSTAVILSKTKAL